MSKQKKQNKISPPPKPVPGNFTRLWEIQLKYFPFIVSALFFMILLYGCLTYHRMGNYGTETDFYVDHIPTAEKLLKGEFSVLNYPFKGPLYSFLMATFKVMGGDYYISAQILSIACSSFILFFLYPLLAHLFNPLTAWLSTIALATNFIFLRATFEVTYDPLFVFFNVLALYYFLKKEPTVMNLFFTGILSGLGFLTRYNGFILVVVIISAIWFLNLFASPWRERIQKSIYYLAGFLVVVSPWIYLNVRETGKPIYTRNWRNIALEFYAYGKGWRDQYGESADRMLDEKFHSLGEVIREDPKYFGTHIVSNIGRNVKNDFLILNTIPIGILTLVGFGLTFFHKIDRRQLLFYLYGILNMLLVTLVIYEPRYSIPVLISYLPLAFYSFSTEWFSKRILGGLKPALYLVLILIVVYSGSQSIAIASEKIKEAPMYLLDFADWIKKHNIDPKAKIIARKPHIGYLSGITCEGYSSFPTSIRTHQELLKHAREKGYKYLLYSEIEAGLRPEFRYLLNAVNQNQKFEGMTLVYYNEYGLLFEFEDQK